MLFSMLFTDLFLVMCLLLDFAELFTFIHLLLYSYYYLKRTLKFVVK